ncbi:hypothetical protein MMZ06_34785 [Burkholderia gladioli]|uniref:hypothetical protein n=1 Tax=Burkholderia gladioli TaxID=28095 RepID=UPI001F4BBA00|nr:hypothetical protein [Burkholderia gladioli]MCH7275002.1 hypothetical protein [Burkholderia gladioli]
MSKKHEQRTRQQILAKRDEPIVGFNGRPAPISRPAGRGKYMPHFGKKQAAKIDGSYYGR